MFLLLSSVYKNNIISALFIFCIFKIYSTYVSILEILLYEMEKTKQGEMFLFLIFGQLTFTLKPNKSKNQEMPTIYYIFAV